MKETKDVIAQTPYLTFSVAGDAYGLSLRAVREILEYESVTRVPEAPPFVRGVLSLRGRPVPVIDLAVRFGLPPAPVTKRTCIVIVDAASGGASMAVGIVADSVREVVELLPSEIEPPPSLGDQGDASFLEGLGRAGKGFVLLLDPGRLFSGADLDEAAAFASATVNDGAGRTTLAAGIASALALSFTLAAPPLRADEPIRDNSFLVEEAYNQERGVVQHINTFSRDGGTGEWLYTFTEEWPLPDERHQLSYTLPLAQLHAATTDTGFGDVAVNYRYQAAGPGGPVAFAPRLSLVAPTGRSREGLGAGGWGVQVNLPLSVAIAPRLVAHWNAGVTRTFSARGVLGDRAGTTALGLGQGLVLLARPGLNLLLETVWTRAESVVGRARTARRDELLVSPGIRFAMNFRSGLQIVPGIAFPIGLGPSRGERSVFLYLSLEHPFRAGAH